MSTKTKWIRSGPKCGGMWDWNGWTVQHCGHPTALHPYELFRPNGDAVTLGDLLPPDHELFSGKGPRGGKRRRPVTPATSAKWAHLADAQAYAEKHG